MLRAALVKLASAAAFSLAFLPASRALAQTDALVDRFTPPPPGEYFAGLPFPRYNGDYYVVMRAGAVARFTHASPGAGAPLDARITWQSVAHPTVFFGVHNSVAFYLGMPVLMHNTGVNDTVSGSARFGDPRIGLRIRILNVPLRAPWSIHLASEFYFPAFWFNGIPATQFTGVSDGTVRGNVGLVFAGSVGLFDARPPAVSNRFIWTAIVEENIRPAANAVRPGPETHLAAGVGLLFPSCLLGMRFTAEMHSWWRPDRLPRWNEAVAVEGVFGVGVRLPAEFEFVASGSVGSAVWGDTIVREGPVAGFTVGLAYAIRDWAAFPLAFDGVPDANARRRRERSREPNDADDSRARDFGATTPWDRDHDGIPDSEDPRPGCEWRPDGHETRAECRIAAGDTHAMDENEQVTLRRGDVLRVEGAGLPVAVEHPLVARAAPYETNAPLQFQNFVDVARIARTVQRSFATGARTVTLFATVQIENAVALHPVLRISTPLRRVWLRMQIAHALTEQGVEFDHVDGLSPAPCPPEESADRTCVYFAVHREPGARSAETTNAMEELGQQGMTMP